MPSTIYTIRDGAHSQTVRIPMHIGDIKIDRFVIDAESGLGDRIENELRLAHYQRVQVEARMLQLTEDEIVPSRCGLPSISNGRLSSIMLGVGYDRLALRSCRTTVTDLDSQISRLKQLRAEVGSPINSTAALWYVGRALEECQYHTQLPGTATIDEDSEDIIESVEVVAWNYDWAGGVDDDEEGSEGTEEEGEEEEEEEEEEDGEEAGGEGEKEDEEEVGEEDGDLDIQEGASRLLAAGWDASSDDEEEDAGAEADDAEDDVADDDVEEDTDVILSDHTGKTVVTTGAGWYILTHGDDVGCIRRFPNRRAFNNYERYRGRKSMRTTQARYTDDQKDWVVAELVTDAELHNRVIHARFNQHFQEARSQASISSFVRDHKLRDRADEVRQNNVAASPNQVQPQAQAQPQVQPQVPGHNQTQIPGQVSSEVEAEADAGAEAEE